MNIIIKKPLSHVVLWSLCSATLLTTTTAQADTYVYQDADGLILLTDKRVKKKGYKLKRIHKEPKRKKTKKRSRKSGKKATRIGCGRLSASKIDQKTRPYLAKIRKYSRMYNVDENLVRAMMRQESCFKPNAKSRVGAMGLMQLMPKTAEYLGVRNAWNPDQNIKGGVKYISKQLKRFKGDKRLALAAYNAGPGAVLKYNGIPPYRETQNYVVKIMKEYKRLSNHVSGHRYTRKLPASSQKGRLPEDFHIFWSKN